MEGQVNNIYPIYDTLVTKEERELQQGYKAPVFWFMGLSASGKSAIARIVERSLFDEGYSVQLLDGDNVRDGLNAGLGFTPQDRYENIRRIAEVAKLMANAGVITICSFITPTTDLQELARSIVGEEALRLVFVDTPIDVCASRDTKGLYEQARNGTLKNFTGVSAPFVPPQLPDLYIDNHGSTIEEAADKALDYIRQVIKQST